LAVNMADRDELQKKLQKSKEQVFDEPGIGGFFMCMTALKQNWKTRKEKALLQD